MIKILLLIALWFVARPLVLLVVAAGVVFVLDRWALQVLPSPVKWWKRRQAIGRLRGLLEVNPHDRKSRYELAELLVETGGHAEALKLCEANLKQGERDALTYALAAAAAYPSGAYEQGEAHAAASLELNPRLRMGEVHLVRGRGRLRHGKLAEAEDALREAIEARPGSVEARVLLAQALRGQSRDADAAGELTQARQLYAEQPKFERRKSYRWAWKANPTAAVLYLGAGAAIIALAVVGAFALEQATFEVELGEFDIDASDPELVVEPYNVDLSAPAPPEERFVVTSVPPGAAFDAEQVLARWDLDRSGTVDALRKTEPGDALCRVRDHYDVWPGGQGLGFSIEDTQTGSVFYLFAIPGAYDGSNDDAAFLESALAFERLLEDRPAPDCEVEGPAGLYGVRGGQAFGPQG